MSPAALPWSQPGWQQSAENWIAERLDALGLRATERVIEQRLRFWSVQLSVQTEQGRVWFKENAPLLAFEARLLASLSRAAPGRVLEPLTIDHDSGRMLSLDQGPTLREAGRAGATEWRRLLVDYALVQRSTGADHLADLGLTRMAPEDATGYVSACVAHWRSMPAGDPRRLDPETAEQILRRLPQVTAWGADLAGSGLALTVEHSDLHTDNAFATRPDAPVQVFDFADAVIAHPLCSLLVPVRSMRSAGDGETPLTEDEISGVIQDYLEVFSDLLPMSELRALVPAALQVGILNRHESWRRALETADAEAPAYADFASAPAGWLELIGS